MNAGSPTTSYTISSGGMPVKAAPQPAAASQHPAGSYGSNAILVEGNTTTTSTIPQQQNMNAILQRASAPGFSLVDTQPLETTIQTLVRCVMEQQEEIKGLKETVALQQENMDRQTKQFAELSSDTIAKFTDTVNVLRREITEAKEETAELTRAGEASMRSLVEDMVCPLAEEMRERWDQQTEWNALRTAEAAYVEDRLTNSTPISSGAGNRPIGGGRSSSPPQSPLGKRLAQLQAARAERQGSSPPRHQLSSDTSHKTTDLQFALQECRQKIDAMWELLSLPSVSEVQAANNGGSQTKVRLMHATPALHTIWSEMRRLGGMMAELSSDASNENDMGSRPAAPRVGSSPSAQRAFGHATPIRTAVLPEQSSSVPSATNNDALATQRAIDLMESINTSGITNPLGGPLTAVAPSPIPPHNLPMVGGTPSAVAMMASGHATSSPPPPSKTFFATNAQHDASRIFNIPLLGVDVMPLAGAMQGGCVIQRVAKGGSMDLAGAVVGDAIVGIEDIAVRTAPQLMDLVASHFEVGGGDGAVVTIKIMPHGRNVVVPTQVKLAGIPGNAAPKATTPTPTPSSAFR